MSLPNDQPAGPATSAEPAGSSSPAPPSHLVRWIREDDVAEVVAMVHELAAYERAPEECHLDAGQLTAALFGDAPALFGHVAVDRDDRPVGVALWFLNFSTWRGVHGIYLEDLYVRPAARGAGLGRALLAELARVCVERGYARLEWWVLDWNAPSRAVYHALGAAALDEWVPYRIDGPALRRLAQRR
ncbi:MAG TPA: GNAT family N-acetyltransferase [Cryptosporangiaceae bacterium]|nr:GNAT family N-acetyltransferase [Cryptosporangiaceae bacterium]